MLEDLLAAYSDSSFVQRVDKLSRVRGLCFARFMAPNTALLLFQSLSVKGFRGPRWANSGFLDGFSVFQSRIPGLLFPVFPWLSRSIIMFKACYKASERRFCGFCASGLCL